jgi:DNA invertase Pin-like site-specific DNA recombinase
MLLVPNAARASEAMAHVVGAFAVLERRLISQRTRDGPAIKRAQGVRLGRPRTLPDSVRRRIRRERDAGKSWSSIVAGLNDEKVPTAQAGTRWHVSTVRKIYATEQAA